MFAAEQQAYFNTFGFCMLRERFSAEEMAAISHDFDAMMDDARQGKPQDGSSQRMLGCVEEHSLMRRLIEDERLRVPMERLLGADFVWLGIDCLRSIGGTGWHPDGSRRDDVRIKILFYLEPVAMGSGCLRMIPGSHRPPFHDELKPLMLQKEDPSLPDPFGIAPRDIPCFGLASQPGDVILFDENIYHAAFNARFVRRLLAMDFCAWPTTDTALGHVRARYQKNLNHTAFYAPDRPRLLEKLARLSDSAMAAA